VVVPRETAPVVAASHRDAVIGQLALLLKLRRFNFQKF
jgi:hypothetical protein